jgi:RHS repeat-associated protein
LQRRKVTAYNDVVPLVSADYTYLPGHGLNTVSSGQQSAAYSYVENSALVRSMGFKTGGATVLTSTWQYDFLNQLTGLTALGAQGQPLDSHGYALNAVSQIANAANADGTHWNYGYDNRGQVTAARKSWADGTDVAGQQYAFVFDDIGNAKTVSSGGSIDGSGHAQNLRTATYDANARNQYTGRSVPPYMSVMGSANAAADVKVNGGAAYRQAGYFWSEFQVDNSLAPVSTALTTVAALHHGTDPDTTSTSAVHRFVPQTGVAFTYDDDGNLTADDRWSYTWDAENRLAGMESLAGAPEDSKRKLTFVYDWAGRRIQRDVFVVNTSTHNYEPSTSTKFIYDGWNFIAELKASDNTLIRSYVWAGNVGGLLWENDSSAINNQPSTHFVTYDGNGNVSTLVNAATGMRSASYEYGPFGDTIKAVGPMSLANPIRFSTKYQDDATGLLYFGYRYYSPSLQRWLNPDPLGIRGGCNLYGFVRNSPLSYVDPDGDAPNHRPYDYQNRVPNQITYAPDQGARVRDGYPLEPNLWPVKAVGVAGEAVGAAALTLLPDPTITTKAGAVLLWADTVDNAQALFSGKTYYQQALEWYYPDVSPQAIQRSILTKDVSLLGVQLGTAVKLAQVMRCGKAADTGIRTFSMGEGEGVARISLDEARQAAIRNGIDLRSMELVYEGGQPSFLFGNISQNGAGELIRASNGRYLVTLTDSGLASAEDAVNTIAHELNHIREIQRLGPHFIESEAPANFAGDMGELFFIK